MRDFREIASAVGSPAGTVAALVFLLGFAPAAFGQTAASATRLTFPTGATEIVVSDNVGAGSVKTYVVNLSAGQPLSLILLHLRSAPGTIGLDVTDAASGTELSGTGRGTAEFTSVVPANGDYVIHVIATATMNPGAGGFGGRYDLRIDVPALVSFDPGAVAAVRSGPTPGGAPVEYVLSLGGGQTLLLDISSAGDGVSLDVNQLGILGPVFESPRTRRLQAAVPIPSDGDYLITLFPATGQNASYRLDMVVPAIAIPANPVSTAFPGPGRIVVVTQEGDTTGPNPKSVHSSIDNGTTWRIAVSPGANVAVGAASDLPAAGKVVGMTFPSSDHGFLTVAVRRQADDSLGPFLYATTDGGANWSAVTVPLPKGTDPGDVAGLTPTVPQFLNGSQGWIDAQIVSAKGASQQLRYVSIDGGRTWVIPAATAAPFVPDAVESQSDLAACLSENEIQGGPDGSGKFNGKTVSQWIAQVERDFSMPVAALSASISPDRQRLAVTFAGCRSSPAQSGPFTIFAVIDARGGVSYFHDQAGKPSYFDGFATSHSKGLYQLFGWLADSRTILISAVPYDLGAGGSCEPTYWASYGADGRPEATFRTFGRSTPAKGNRVVFYAGPDPCSTGQNEIHEVQTATGKDTIVYTGSQDAIIEITGASETPNGAIEVRYQVPGGKEQKLTFPR